MHRVWVVVLSVWAMLAIVAVLAWSSRPAVAAAPQLAPQQVLVKGPNGKSHLVVLKSPVARDDGDLRGGAADEHALAHRMARRRHELLGGRHRRQRRRASRPRRARRRAGRRSRPSRPSSPASVPTATSRVSTQPRGSWVPVGRRLLEALRLAIRAREDTGGRFDPDRSPGPRRRRLRPLLRAARGTAGRARARLACRSRRSSSTTAAAARGSSPAPPSTSAGSARATPPGARSTRCSRVAPSLPRRPRRPRRRHRRPRRVSRRRRRGGSPSAIRAARARRSPCSRSRKAASQRRVAMRAASARRARSTTSSTRRRASRRSPARSRSPSSRPTPSEAEAHATTLAIAGLDRGRGARRRASAALRSVRPARRPGHPARPAAASTLPGSWCRSHEHRAPHRVAHRARCRPRRVRAADAVGLARARDEHPPAAGEVDEDAASASTARSRGRASRCSSSMSARSSSTRSSTSTCCRCSSPARRAGSRAASRWASSRPGSSLALAASFNARKWIGQKGWRRLHFASFGAFWLALGHAVLTGTDLQGFGGAVTASSRPAPC